MTEQNSESEKDKRRFDPELPKKGLRCDLDQYEMLKRCSDKKDMTEWNEWRKNNRTEDIELEGKRFSKWHLHGVDLNGGRYKREGEEELIRQGEIYLKGTEWYGTNLRGAKLRDAHIESAFFYLADIQGAVFQGADVDNYTEFWRCNVDHKTNFRGVALDIVVIDPATKQFLEYNIRRKNWEEWYKQHKILKWPVWLFWLMSDYGLSSRRIIASFVGLVIVFSSIYYIYGLVAPPGIVDYLFVDGNGVEVAWWLVPIRAIHFSVVIMTVGFTNMHANAHSFWAHILVGLQIILGFVLLGALVTRFAVLFTAGGPAGKFADEKKKTDKIL